MEISTKFFFKFPLVLVVFLGLVFGSSCAFNQKTFAHSTPTEVGVVLVQGEETCCGTNLLPQNQPLSKEYLILSRAAYRNLFDLFTLSLVAIFMIFGRRFLYDVGSRLSALHSLYLRDNSRTPFLNYLILAFSRGILNPKEYSFAFSN